MKLSIFVNWICLQILSAQCDAFLNNLNASDVSTKVCIQKTINHLFSCNDTLSLILDNDFCKEAIFEMNTTRPLIILNKDAAEEGIQLQYGGHLVICPVDAQSLADMMSRMEYKVAVLYKRGLGNLKVLVITNTISPRQICYIFWFYGINNLIVLFYVQGISKLAMCDRFSPNNACGQTVKSIISKNCEKKLTFSFTKVINQMNKCPITFIYLKGEHFDKKMEKKHPIVYYIMHFLQELSNRHNATFQRTTYKDFSELETYTQDPSNITIRLQDSFRNIRTNMEPLIRTDVVWLVPKAEEISNMNAFVQVFNYNLWIAVGVTLGCVSLTWFVIISYNGRFTFTFDKLGLAFINVWSLTICGCIANFPRSLALRITLLSYLIYVIHIQCAFTSDMATILTTPRYGFQIRNLEELAESGLPIYILHDFNEFFNQNDINHTLYDQLRKQMRPVPPNEWQNAVAKFNHNRNYSVIGITENIRVVEKVHEIDYHLIRDNSITGQVVFRLCSVTDHYFTPTVNSLIRKMEESGIGDKIRKDIDRECFGNNNPMEENSEVLTLSHLSFIFIFFGLGLSISCVVFCLEIVVHKYL